MNDHISTTSLGSPGDPTTLFRRVGGSSFFEQLVARFYAGVSGDEVLRPMYPTDLAPAERRFFLFLQQYWGGPTTYDDERGHPRLRMRHARFTVDEAAKSAWLGHMASALDGAADLDPADRTLLDDYLRMAAEHMVNA